MKDWRQPGLTLAEYEQLVPLDKTDIRLLLMFVTGKSRIQLITQGDTVPETAQAESIRALLERRLSGEPIAYLTGEREFFGLSFITTPAVLIPRPDTELLVELALEKGPANASVLDLGTGSGAIAISIASHRPDWQVTAADISTAALEVARRNAHRILPTSALTLVESDWFRTIPAQRWDLIVSNPPYIVAGDPHLSQGDLRFEPLSALTDHGDGLSAYRTLTRESRTRLQPGGWLLMEHGYDQAEAVRALLDAEGYTEVQSWRDLAGIERVSGGRCPVN